jgi:Protein of unknown function (DUF3606)
MPNEALDRLVVRSANMMRPGTMKRIIHTDDDCYDLIYWSIKFGVSIEQLIQAVAEVGPLVMNVERHLSPSTAAMADPSAANLDATEVRSTATPSFAPMLAQPFSQFAPSKRRYPL